MKLNLKCDPFPHVIIDEFFSEKEYADVWREIRFCIDKMKSPIETLAAINSENGEVRKRGLGTFLKEVFSNPNDSKIFLYTKKMVTDKQLISELSKFNFIFNYLRVINSSSILIQKYSNEDFYKHHVDIALFTSVTMIHTEPKMFSGGELKFPDYDYSVCLKPNQNITFPSFLSHEVTKIITNSDNPLDHRYTITHFLNCC